MPVLKYIPILTFNANRFNAKNNAYYLLFIAHKHGNFSYSVHIAAEKGVQVMCLQVTFTDIF